MTWIAKPSFGVSTVKAYAAFRAQESEKCDPLAILKGFLQGSPLFFNDLENPAFHISPALREIKYSLQKAGFSTVVMTGSGSAFICLGLSTPPHIDGLVMIPILPIQREAEDWYSKPLNTGN
jgi:4-diphosphocytidyl-2-C-methyl-D-erythritol kinase